MIVCATGHRPKVFGTYDENDKVIVGIKKAINNFMGEREISKFISGMAIGIDMWSAEIALELGIPLVAAVPFRGQEKIWIDSVKKRYDNIVKKASEIYVIDVSADKSINYEEFMKLDLNKDTYFTVSAKFNKRNEWMVNHSDMVMAVWNGEKGGTGHCIKYAKAKKVKTINLWREEWLVE